MKGIVIALLLVALCLHGRAQKLQGKARLDSLLAELPNAKADTSAVNLYNNIAFAYSRFNPDSGLYFGNRALAMAKQLNWPRGIAYGYINTGINYSQKSDFKTSIEYQQKALRLLQQQNNQIGVGSCLSNMGHMYLSLNEHPKSLAHFFEALRIFE